MKFTYRIASFVIVLASVSCQTEPRSDSSSQPPGLTHVVVCWQKHPGDEAERGALMGSVQTIRTIPGVVNAYAGSMVASTRPVVDSTWDVAFVITFADQQSMNSYVTDPIHVKLKHDVLDPNVRQVKIFDLQSYPHITMLHDSHN